MGKSIIDHLSVTRVGLNLGKNILQVHPVDASDVLVVERQVAARRVRRFLRQVAALCDRGDRHHESRRLPPSFSRLHCFGSIGKRSGRAQPRDDWRRRFLPCRLSSDVAAALRAGE